MGTEPSEEQLPEGKYTVVRYIGGEKPWTQVEPTEWYDSMEEAREALASAQEQQSATPHSVSKVVRTTYASGSSECMLAVQPGARTTKSDEPVASPEDIKQRANRFAAQL